MLGGGLVYIVVWVYTIGFYVYLLLIYSFKIRWIFRFRVSEFLVEYLVFEVFSVCAEFRLVGVGEGVF